MAIFYERLALLLLLLSRNYNVCLTQAALDLTEKYTDQSSTYFVGSVSYSSGLAVDRMYTTLFTSCSTTLIEVNPWWYVDLGAQYSVTYVRLYAAQGYAVTLAGTEVRVGNVAVEPFTGNAQCGSTIALENLSNNQYSVPCSLALVGRYITLYRSDGDSSSMNFIVCEVDVFGELEEPVVSCPGDMTVYTSPGQSTGTTSWFPPTVTDNTDTLTATCTPSSGSSFTFGTTTVTCTATDSKGIAGSCAFNVIVKVPEEPVVSCPDDMTVFTSPGQSTGSTSWIPPTVTDNTDTLTATCTPSSGSSFTFGRSTVTCTATDSMSNTGSCAFNVIVEDNENPSVLCPATFAIGTTSSQAIVTWSDPTVTDNVDIGLSATCIPSYGSLFNVGKTDVTCSATDTSGNTGSCTFEVFVIQDTERPIVTCPTDIMMSAASGQASVTWSDPAVTDSSVQSATCSPPSGSLFFFGSSTVTCYAYDIANNYGSCQFDVVIVRAPEEPVVNCPPVSIDTSPGQSSGTATWSEPTVTDNIDTGLTATCNPSSGSSFAVGINIVMCTSTDSDSNVGDCTFTVTVIDMESPILTCPGDISVSTASSQATVTWSDPTVSDNVDIGLPVTCTPSSGSSFNVGSTDVTCSATDSALNIGNCVFTVTVVEDNVNPNVTCPTDIAVNTGSQANWDDPTVVDNIDTEILATCTPSSGSSFKVVETNVTCSATDSAGNEGSCMFVVEVNNGNTDTIGGDDESSNTTTIVVIVLVVTLILIIIAIILVWRIRVKRRDIKSPEPITFSANKGISGNGLEQQIHEPLTPEITHTQDNNTELPYINQDIRKPAISIQDLPEYVRVKKASGELAEEWELLPEGVESSGRASVAFESQNATKNRYRNVVPYDEHRVVLEKTLDDPYSDYINACFIKGFTNEKAYIAAQGPNKATLADFWRMIWQENVYSIVMVTNLVEDGKNKCTKYWPEDAKRYGDIFVSSVEFVPTTSFTIRKLKLMKGKDVKYVQQYHFLVWPDKNIPRASSPVISMLKVIRKEEPQNAGPVLVHCSAGAGRTGAIIAIDAMMDMAQQTGEVNVFEFVKEMRKRRPNMVQTPLQYKFVYDTLLEFVIFGETSIPVSDFKEHYKKLCRVNPKSNKTYLSEEFEALQSISSTREASSTKGGLRPENRDKNRYPHILPFDGNRPFIMTPGENGPSDYINASFFDSFDKKDMFLGTQAPMRNTVEDFWRMIVDYNSKAIVTLNDFYNRDKTVAQFWPENSSKFTFRHLTVTLLTSENLSKQVKVHTVDVMKTDENSGSFKVKIFEYLGWPAERYTPTSSKEFLQLVTVVNKRQSEIGEPSVVVMCMDGVGRTGVFCATLSSLRKVTEEQTVDIVQGVKLLRNNRPGMVETLSQYEFIYKTVLEHLLAFEVYDNLPQENEEEAVYANV